MSWLFSLALVEESLAGTYLDGELSAPWSGNLTPLAFLSHGKTTDFSRLSRFGVTFRPLMDDLGEELLMSYLAGFHAKTSVLPEKAQALRAHGPGCGGTWPASLARFDPISSSWKTVQLSLLGDSELSSVTWPRSGMTAAGQCWELPMSAPPIRETGSGLWLGTPPATMSVRSELFRRECALTPAEFVKWPTPTVCGNYNRKGASATSGDGLATAVKTWPTPRCQMTRPVKARKEYEAGHNGNLEEVVALTGVTGVLNPTWVEWLMGWPLGWTDLKPLGTDKSHCVLLKHSDS